MSEHVHGYAGLDLELFPVDPRDKSPLVSQYQATTDLDQLDEWWSRWPEALIGHLIGENYVLLDIDPRHGGMEAWKALKVEMPPFTTRTHLSGRGDGGGHVWWIRPDGKLTTTKLDAWAKERGYGCELKGGRWTSGIDLLRREHRYTILPPSPHPDTGKPYRWAAGRGLALEPIAMPAFLEGLIVVEKIDAPPNNGPRYRAVDSPADWYSDNYRWADILRPAGWTLVAGDGESDGSRWRHPEATTSHSAAVRHGLLFVFSSSTAFEPTEPDDPHGYTPFAAYALLEHDGDQKAAARVVRETMMPQVDVGVRVNAGAVARLPDEFWSARPHLAHIRQAALARRCNPDALLHYVLARVSAFVPHTLRLPPIVRAEAPLCYFVVPIGLPGSGKSSTNRVAAELLPPPGWAEDQVPLGSGEGLAELLIETVDDLDHEGKKRKVRRQTRHNAFVFVDEGRTMIAFGKRQGATVLETIRTIWTGGPLGQANASEERRRIIPTLSYTYGLVVGFQLGTVGDFLEDAEAGTPQRFAWCHVNDLDPPAERPDWPGSLALDWPGCIDVDGGLTVAAEIAADVDAREVERQRHPENVALLDTHGDLLQLKVAGLLAVLEARTDIEAGDWRLASMVRAASDAVRAGAVAAADAQKGELQRQSRERYIRREVEADAARERRRVVDCARRIAAKVWAEPERWTRTELRRSMSKWREEFDDGLDHAVAEGWVVETAEPGQGDDKRCLRPGEVRP